MKDNFSKQAEGYSIYRPAYPTELFDFILKNTTGRQNALDCGTGNGQVATQLANHFERVVGIDISENQIKNGSPKKNIQYLVSSAESTQFQEKFFDLITVGQAAHWFHLNDFYTEVTRIMKPGGTLALFGYQLPEFGNEVDDLIQELYVDILGDYWDDERKLVDEGYANLHFPFSEIENKGFSIEYEWTCEQTLGFLCTWSAIQHYLKATGTDPMVNFTPKFKSRWGDRDRLKITFPVFLLMAKI